MIDDIISIKEDAKEYTKEEKELPTNSDLHIGLKSIGSDNCKTLYKYIKTIYKKFIKTANELDRSNDDKIKLYMHHTIGDVTVKTHIYNTNDLMQTVYSSLEAKIILDFKLYNNGLKFYKEIKASGSQDFGGCDAADIRQLLYIIKQFI
jgi:hypothetical protein